jgi:SAM-dependent methyltransferase
MARMTTETADTEKAPAAEEAVATIRQERATRFGAAAGTYDRYRVGMPAEVVERLLPAGAGAVLDLGAGTGAMTRRLVEKAEKVYAVEPDPRMIEVLRANCPRAEAREGTAERIPLPDGCVDAVVVASAWHWMEPATAIPEIARVLRPGGALCIVWNRRDRTVPWVADLEAVRNEVTGGDDWVEQRIHHYLGNPWLPENAPFADIETKGLTWQAGMTKDEIVRLMTTFGSFISAPEEQKPDMLRKIGEYVHGDERIVAEPGEGGEALVELPMVCHLWRAALV